LLAYLFTDFLYTQGGQKVGIQYTYFSSTLYIYPMEQSPSWETNQFSASQEIPCILWKPKVHNRTQKFPPPVPILDQINPVHVRHPTSQNPILILSSHSPNRLNVKPRGTRIFAVF